MSETTHYCPRCDAYTPTPCRAAWHTALTSSEPLPTRRPSEPVEDFYDESDEAVLCALYRALADPESGWTIYRPAIRVRPYV